MQAPRKALIPTTVLLVALITVTAHQNSEIEAQEYRILRDGFKRGTAEYRAAVAVAMRNGDVSRWELRNLLSRYPSNPIAFSTTHQAMNLREERLILAAMTRQLQSP